MAKLDFRNDNSDDNVQISFFMLDSVAVPFYKKDNIDIGFVIDGMPVGRRLYPKPVTNDLTTIGQCDSYPLGELDVYSIWHFDVYVSGVMMVESSKPSIVVE